MIHSKARLGQAYHRYQADSWTNDRFQHERWKLQWKLNLRCNKWMCVWHRNWTIYFSSLNLYVNIQLDTELFRHEFYICFNQNTLVFLGKNVKCECFLLHSKSLILIYQLFNTLFNQKNAFYRIVSRHYAVCLSFFKQWRMKPT